MPGLDSQLRLAAVLRYLRRGDFGSFKRAAELAGHLRVGDGRFAAPDVFLACQMAGFIEVESTDGERLWWSTLDQPIDIRSARPKAIPTREPQKTNEQPRSLISDKDGNALIWGLEESANTSAEACDFGPGFLGRLPRLPAIEKQTTRYEQLSAGFAVGHIEKFLPEECGWRPVPPTDTPVHALLRMRREYGPWMYAVTLEGPHQGILLSDQEWALPLARNILGWSLSNFLRVDGSVTLLARAFRLPSLILRVLFANAVSVTLGPWLRVHGLEPRVRDEFSDYLDGVR